jgi:hypothetical protein
MRMQAVSVASHWSAAWPCRMLVHTSYYTVLCGASAGGECGAPLERRMAMPHAGPADTPASMSCSYHTVPGALI